jgi:hypothetical protein
MHEMAESLEKTLALREAEVAALKRLLEPLYRNYRHYRENADSANSPRIDVKSKYSWHDIADALRTDATANISHMMPNLKAVA